MRIAVVGSGVAGLTAAWLLQNKGDVHLFESADYAGGHSRTVTLKQGPDAGCPVDTGFIVMNHRNYPLLTRLFERLDVALGDSDMSFSYHCPRTGYAYSGTDLNGVFARRRNLVSPRHWRMLLDIIRFNREATQQAEADTIGNLTLGQYLEEGRYSSAFAEHYLLAMGAAIWSSPSGDILGFPAASFIHFFRNHGLLSLNDRPQWRYVKGGSQTYVSKMLADFDGSIRLSCPVRSIRRTDTQILLRLQGEAEESFDRVIIATHADDALDLLADPTGDEQRLLGSWQYQPNTAILHTDASVMPKQKAAWASWNFTRIGDGHEGKGVAITYYMNRLQRLDTEKDYFVTLNMEESIRETCCLDSTIFTHPMYAFDSLTSQAELATLNGSGKTFFCGSYFGYGFHEDAVRSAADVAAHFGVAL